MVDTVSSAQRVQLVDPTTNLPYAASGGSGGGGGGPATIANGADVAQGNTADAAATTDSGTFSLISLTKRLLGKIPVLGQTTMAASQPVTFASDQSTLPVSVSGVSTAANQTTGNTSLATIATNTTGVSTAANQTTMNTTLGSPFQAGGSIGNTSFASTQSGTWNITNVSGTVSLPTGASTAAKQPALGTAGSASTDVLSVQGIASGTALVVGGNVASGAADSGNPVKAGGVYSSSSPTLTAGNRGDLQLNVNGNLKTVIVGSQTGASDGFNNAAMSFPLNPSNASALPVTAIYVFNGTTWDRARGDVNGQINQPYALASSRWGYAAASGGISNTTTAVTIIAAGGAGVRNYITSLQVDAGTLGAATEIAVRDGAGGTVLWRGFITTGGVMRQVNFPVPLKGTANTLMEVVTLTASVTGSVYFNAQGFQGT